MSVHAEHVPDAAGIGGRGNNPGVINAAMLNGRRPFESLWRAALVFLPFAIVTTVLFAILFKTEVEATRAIAIRAGLASGWIAALAILAAMAWTTGRQIVRRREAEAEAKRLSERLARDNESLQALKQELESFSYSVSHDLRTPLRAIDGFSKALLDDFTDSLDARARDHLGRVRNAAQRMGELIDDLLQLSRVGRAALNLEDGVNLSEIAMTTADDLKRLEPNREVKFAIAPAVTARCDRQLIRIVLENLLANAWKFTGGREPAVIEFGRTDVDGRPAFFVRDNGVGFDMAHAKKLFGAFQRLHADHEFPGTGIGLATVERIVDKHGGRAWADGVPDRGATLFFAL